ncbi:hypothetical protein NNJEOMEG_03149 [Fundidesulfovibrio magnetotacticus]|uniref:HD domain-containing protein n=1 Tax=Fundidesulfovibrio magnetotacticus TaxID=2730080 RepID=A0A6V8LWM2_9BACT|nr:HD domain-containing protein [Fundidesulfovibrio magnetotacticus]GFK95290.1 hypothetical protein NNJEOMEG_03149 [Fundidesulfovibrio magnetotacticus]
MTRNDALELLESRKPEPHMLLHALQTEAVLRAMALRLEQDAELWGITGLLHDLDFPTTKDAPERHGLDAAAQLDGRLDPAAVAAIAAHNAEMNGRQPAATLDYALRCGETVTGIVHAAALMRPTGYDGLEPKSVKKKMKDKAFARNVRREIILECDKAGLPLDDFLALAIDAMRSVQA